MAEVQIEMLWRCSACRVRNLGRHAACTGCGNPKDGSEEYEMPGDVEAAPVVTDPALLRMATAGENWRCRFCSSHQRRLDGECAHCGGEQAQGETVSAHAARIAGAAGAAKPVGSHAEAEAAPGVRTARAARRRGALIVGGIGGLLLLLLVLPVSALLLRRTMTPAVAARLATSLARAPRYAIGKVVGFRWEREIVVERKQDVLKQGFAEAIPQGARAVTNIGTRQHHTERVQDGFKTVHYSERVQDGTRSESYTERVRCGESCSTTPRTCRRDCKSNKNGFATCTDKCTGGDRRCSPKYCTESRTRQIPKYKDVQRSRLEPRMVERPVMAPWMSYRVWEWTPNRTVRAAGGDKAPRWPSDDEVALGQKLGPGEEERAVKREAYSVTVRVSVRVEGEGDQAGAAASADRSYPVAAEAAFVGIPDGAAVLLRRLGPSDLRLLAIGEAGPARSP